MQQTSDSRYRLRARTLTCMGTVISVTVPSDTQKAPGTAEDELEAATSVVERLFTELDETFSLYRPDSEASRLARGELVLRDASAEMRGLADWCVNAGGDVLVSGSPTPGSGESWRAGIVDPADRRTLLAGFPLGGGKVALATSGSAERGDHIWSAAAGAAEFRQVSVAAGDAGTADVLATAIVAGGTPMLHRATALWDIDALAVRRGGELLATPGFRR